LNNLLIANGLFDEAIPCLVQVERLDPKDPHWPYWHGALLLASNPREGLPKLRQALALCELDEYRAAVLLPLALTLVEMGDLDEAAGHLQALETIEGPSPRVRYGLGLLALARDDRSEARRQLEQLTDNPYTRQRVCTLLAGLTDGDEALAKKYWKAAKEPPADRRWPSAFEDELRPYKIEPRRRLAAYQEMEAQGRTEDALEYLQRLAVTSPDEDVCFTLGHALLRRNELARAAAALRQALGFNPRNVKAHYLLAEALLREGEKRGGDPGGKEQARELFGQAVRASAEAVRLQEGHAHAHLTRARALQHLGRKEEALAALRAAVVAGPQFSETHLALGEALAEAGQIDEALKHLEDAVRVAGPGDSRPREALEKWSGKARERRE
jgi:tetratricopeptide (TPR) repeat protein